VVLDALSKVDIAAEFIAVSAFEMGAEDRNVISTLDVESDGLSAVGEVYCNVLVSYMAGWNKKKGACIPLPSQ
jgi:hypothetical protein